MATDPAKKSLVIVFTGKGKGKTTAALGILLRAWGRGLRVVMLSFIKAETSNYGEHRAARKMGVEIIPLGAGYTWLSKDIEKDKAMARRCWEMAREKIASGLYDVVLVGGVEKMTGLPTERVTDALSLAGDTQYETPAGFTFAGGGVVPSAAGGMVVGGVAAHPAA